MKSDKGSWMHWWVPVGLALVSLLFVLGALDGRFALGDVPPPAQGDGQFAPPSPEEEALWAAVGLNEAWYVVNGYTEQPPPSAPSPFWPEESSEPSQVTELTYPSDTLDNPQVVTATLFADPQQPRLWVDTNLVVFRASVLSRGVLTRSVEIRNTGGQTMTWEVEAITEGVAPAVFPQAGTQNGFIDITVDSRGYPTITAVYTGRVIVNAKSGNDDIYPVLDNPQEITVRMETALHTAHMPRIFREPTPTPTATPTPTPTPTQRPDLGEVRAIWVTRYDWTPVKDAVEGRGKIDEIVSKVAYAGFNTIFFQIRGTADAYYRPGLEPWSDRLNAGRVLGLDPGWDPLGYLIEKAHEHGIQVHAYVNTYPTWLDYEAPLPDTTPKHPYWTWREAFGWDGWRHWDVNHVPMELPDPGDDLYYLWASPGVDGVRDHIVEVVKDIVRRYAVDGVHLDLVRYAGRDYSYDPISDRESGSDVKTPARDQWQRDRVTGLVSRVYSAIRDIRSGTRLSAAVWFCHDGNVNDKCGYGLSDGYDEFYQDSVGWLSAGVIDAIAPMLYGANAFQSNWAWRDVMLQFQGRSAGRHVYPGISGNLGSFSDIAARIQYARDAGAAGHAIFSYGAVDSRGYWDDFAAGPYAQPAMLSPLPW